MFGHRAVVRFPEPSKSITTVSTRFFTTYVHTYVLILIRIHFIFLKQRELQKAITDSMVSGPAPSFSQS